MGFTTLLTSQVMKVAFYSEREKSDKFCSEPLILAWRSFPCRNSTTQDPRLYDILILNTSNSCFFFLPNSLRSGYEDFHSFLLSSDIRSEGSIAIVKKFDFDFLIIFDSTSLKCVLEKMSVCVCVCLSVCLSVADRRA